ncbi:hypothetical protein SAMN05216276_104265 [Streptosporangium subroseum]|uniref:Uncharacterized protein n=1 Tax=Streptosporangium subroseum TaxID=106412 RepID=A0A239MKS9_9ACTN|nr:hypothetical protein SAMN05216276_104265 [Streptosporangium subroseum]
MNHATAQVKATVALPPDATGRAVAPTIRPPIRDGWPRRLRPRPIRDGAGPARFGTGRSRNARPLKTLRSGSGEPGSIVRSDQARNCTISACASRTSVSRAALSLTLRDSRASFTNCSNSLIASFFLPLSACFTALSS